MKSSDLIKQKIPISDYSVTDVNSSDLIKQKIPISINVNTINLGQKDPYAQFRFPKLDPPLTKAGKLEISKLDSLEYLINLMAGKLQPDLKKEWDELAGRDITLKEISKSGMQLTGYDLKHECAKFKKAGEKQKYIDNLTKISAFDSQVNQVNFIRPTSGPLSEILKECGDKKQQFHDCLYKIYYNDKDKFSILLNEIQQYMIQKKSRKIVNRFKRLIECENPKIYKVSYFMRFITRTVYHGKKVYNTIKVQNMYTEESCCDCPQVFLTLGTTKNLYTALLDTGAQASLIGYNCLKEFGYKNRDIKKTGATLNIESTTGLVKNAILGTITIQIYIMLRRRNTENSREFGRTKVTFLVASPEVNLNRIILGVPWLRAARTKIELAKDQVRARLLHSNSTESECSLQLKIGKNLQLESEKVIDETTNYARFHMNAFFLRNKVAFKVHQKNDVVLPDIINMQNAIEITMDHGYPRILNDYGLELPVRTQAVFQKLTINLTIMKEPTCEETACKEVQPSLQEIQTTPRENTKSEKINTKIIQDAANFISLPREALIHGDDNTVKVEAAELSETSMCNKCNVYITNCSCRKMCNTCQE